MKVEIGISARHVHLTKDDYIYLFEKDNITKYKDLKQPNQFASVETVNLITNKGRFNNVRIIGPFRDYTQVEISKTDSYILGLNPPICDSGDLTNAESIIIEHNGKIIERECVIIANRHIHIARNELSKYGLEDGQIVKLRVYGQKAGVLYNVKIKASDDAYLECHLDTDDANANMIDLSKLGDVIYE